MTLKNIGLRIQLGHPRGDPCLNPRPSTDDDFVIIDTTGIHEIALDFCDCQAEGTKRPDLQLLRASLYPSTSINPNTAATFTVLKHFQMLTFEGKLSAFAFIRTLERLTNNTTNTVQRVSV